MATYVNRLCGGTVKNYDVTSIIIKHVDELGPVQIPELVTVSDTSCKPRPQKTSLMFSADCRYSRVGCKNPISPLKEYEANVGLTDDRIAARIALLFVSSIEVIGHNEVGVSPNVGGREVTVVLSSNDVGKIGTSSPIDVKRRCLDRVSAFVKTDERAHREPSLGFHLAKLTSGNARIPDQSDKREKCNYSSHSAYHVEFCGGSKLLLLVLLFFSVPIFIIGMRVNFYGIDYARFTLDVTGWWAMVFGTMLVLGPIAVFLAMFLAHWTLPPYDNIITDSRHD